MDLVTQKNNWSCGPSCAKMVAPDTRPPRASKKNGLSPDAFIAWAERHDLLLHAGWNLSLAPGMIALVMFLGTTHYVVITQVTDRHVWFNCPWDGKVRLGKKAFEAIWTGWGMLCR